MRVYPEDSNADADVYDGRASWTVLPNLTISGEYAYEDDDDLRQGLVRASAVRIRRRRVETDVHVPLRDVRRQVQPDSRTATPTGAIWFQGEIAGNYPLSNNNLNSNMLRVKMSRTKSVTVNLFYYNFTLDDPTAFGVTSDDYGDEVDLTVDWQATDRIFVTVVLAQLNPGDAAEQRTGGNKDWKYAMLSVSFTL